MTFQSKSLSQSCGPWASTWLLLALSACDAPADTHPAAVTTDPTAWMVRASLDLRGVRLTDAERDQLADDPDSAPAMIDAWLDDERFELRVRDLFARVWRTRVDRFADEFFDESYGAPDTPAFRAAVGDEPLVLIGRVAALDRPFTDIVTSPTTWANKPLSKLFPVDYPSDGEGWMEVTYTDGRPMAGVLSTNGLWWRYLSTPENFNRGRANAISRILLCNDFAARPVTFSRAEAPTDGVDRTQTDPTCLSCHAALDPLASLMFGFHAQGGYAPTPTYTLSRERDWLGATGVAPAYFGRPVANLGELGAAIADDPRFLDCAVEQVYTGLLQLTPEQADPAALERHGDRFVQSGARLKALYRSIVLDPDYAATPLRMLPVESLAAAVEDLTGFVWEDEGAAMLGTDAPGLRTLGGGMDGRNATRIATAPSTTTVLVAQRLAELAAPHAVATDADRPEDQQLFAGIDFGESLEADRGALEDTVRRLSRRALGRDASDEEVTALLDTWSEAAALATPQDAWATVLAVLIRDPAFVLY